jgi:hypothetical protein
MSIRQDYAFGRRLSCDGDGCNQGFSYPQSWWWTLRLIRETVESQGWTRPLVNGKRADLCPSCSAKKEAKK